MKTKLIKKSIIYTLIGSMLFGGVTPAFAGKDSIGEVTKTQETDKNENMNTTVYAEVGSFFTVSIPKHIVLDGTEKKGAYTVSAIGDIAGYETLYVTPDKSFALSSNNLNDVTATINQDKTSWKFNEMLEDSNISGNGLIDAKDITAGSWNGNFNFNIFLDGTTTSIKVEAKDENGNNLNASAFDINGSEKEALLNGLVEKSLINSTDEVNALIEVKSDEFEGLADTTFDVSSIAKEGDKVAILHFDETKQEWEYIGTETVNSEGKISADFTSYSPVAFVKVNEDGIYETKKYNSDFANNTWVEIIEAVQSNNVPISWNVGDTKIMLINDKEIEVTIVGKNHDTYTEGGIAPLTFAATEIIGLAKMNSTDTNVGGWNSCEMRTVILPEIMGQMPSEVKSAIREVTKLSSIGNKSKTLTTTNDTLFLFSENEVGVASYSSKNEGSLYEYFNNNSNRILKLNGTAQYWWLRSPDTNDNKGFCNVNNNGLPNNSIRAYNNFGVVFGFCF